MFQKNIPDGYRILQVETNVIMRKNEIKKKKKNLFYNLPIKQPIFTLKTWLKDVFEDNIIGKYLDYMFRSCSHDNQL